MSPAIDPVDLASRLIACPSVTPAEGGAQAGAHAQLLAGVVAGDAQLLGLELLQLAAGEHARAGDGDGDLHLRHSRLCHARLRHDGRGGREY